MARKKGDPLVPIDGDRVRATLECRGLSVNDAARRIGEKQQTLNSIVQGETKRCRQSRRRKLAELLGYPFTEEWLGAETPSLPGLPPWFAHPGLGGFVPGFVADANLAIRWATESGQVLYGEGLPPRYEIAAHSLYMRVRNAWERDMEHEADGARETFRWLGSGDWQGLEWERLLMAIQYLLSAFWWRRFFLKPPDLTVLQAAAIDPKKDYNAEVRRAAEALKGTAADPTWNRTAELRAAAEELATAGVAALDAALRPWFEGRAELEYDTLRQALHWSLSGLPGVVYSRPTPGMAENSSDLD